MPQPGPAPDWDEFRGAIRDLERRVARLEERLQAPTFPAAIARPAPVPGQPSWSLVEGAATVPAIGRALLGIAGAYVLRALTESGVLPQKAGVAAGILYATAWLVWAARVSAARRLIAVLYSLTAAMILGPLLWEAAIRFRVISAWQSATVLFLFTATGLGISWRKNLLPVATIATLTSVLAAVVLLIGSHDAIPFTFLLLAIAAAAEFCAYLEHWLGERWLSALASDGAVWLVTYLVTNPNGLPEVYAPIPRSALLAAQVALPVIYIASTTARTLHRRLRFSYFETVQLAAALAIGIGGGIRLAPGAVAVATLCLAAASYFAAFRLPPAAPHRNFHIYAGFGLALTLVATRMLMPGTSAALWCFLAALSTAAAPASLHWQACVYLVAGLFSSGALLDGTRLLLGSGPADGLPIPILWAAAAALVCFGLVLRKTPHPLLRFVFAGAALWLVGAILSSGLAMAYHRTFGATASHAYCATFRTATLSAAAIAVAWTVSRWNWVELKPLVYMLVCLGAYRLVMVDLAQGTKTALVFSLLAYGTGLMVVPRWLSRGGKMQS